MKRIKINFNFISLTLIFIFGFLYRLYYIYHGSLEIPHSDALWYDELARNIVLFGRYSVNGQPFAFYTPGYPLFLAGIYKLFGLSNFPVVRVFQTILSALSMMIFYKIIKSQLGVRAAWISTLLATFYFPFIYANGFILTESLYIFVEIVWIYLLMARPEKGWMTWQAIVWGLVWGVMLLIRPITVLFWGLCFILKITSKASKPFSSFVPETKYLVISGLAISVVLSPWIIRNFVIFGRFIPLSAESGNVLLQGSYINYQFDRSDWPIGKNEIETDNLKLKYAISRLETGFSKEPLRYGEWLAKKFTIFFTDAYTNIDKLFPSLTIQRSWHKILVLLGIIGIYLGLKQKLKFSYFSGVFILYLSLIHTIFMTLDRLALPSMFILIAHVPLSLKALYEKRKTLGLAILLVSIAVVGFSYIKGFIRSDVEIHEQTIAKAIDIKVPSDKLNIFIAAIDQGKADIQIGVNGNIYIYSAKDFHLGWNQVKLRQQIESDAVITLTMVHGQGQKLVIGAYKYKNLGWSDMNKKVSGSYMIAIGDYQGSNNIVVRQRLSHLID